MATTIKVLDDGPLAIEGEVRIVDPQGKVVDTGGKPAVALCRCGQSATKPFCDGAHRKAGFTSKVRGQG